MTLNVRRVVTGLDSNGKSTVALDDIASNKHSGRSGHESVVLWAFDRRPANILGDEDPSKWVATPSPLPNGSIFRITEYGPGVQSRMHRNDSLDYSNWMVRLKPKSGELTVWWSKAIGQSVNCRDFADQRTELPDNWIYFPCYRLSRF